MKTKDGQDMYKTHESTGITWYQMPSLFSELPNDSGLRIFFYKKPSGKIIKCAFKNHEQFVQVLANWRAITKNPAWVEA